MLDRRTLTKIMNSQLFNKAIASFDTSTLTIMGIAWAAALCLMIMATYTTTQAVTARKTANSALAAEPILPRIDYEQLDSRTLQPIIERMKTQATGITLSAQNNGSLKVSTQDGALFKTWLITLGYLNSAYPQYHWTIEEMCVGSCKGELMNATIRGESVKFTIPENKRK